MHNTQLRKNTDINIHINKCEHTLIIRTLNMSKTFL